jgi:hypothetical protein
MPDSGAAGKSNLNGAEGIFLFKLKRKILTDSLTILKERWFGKQIT